MQLKLLYFGKLKSSYLKEGIDEYTKRIRRYADFSIIGLKDPSKDSKGRLFLKAADGLKLSRHLSGGFNIVLDERGKNYTSQGFADFIDNLLLRNIKKINFIIGGPYGIPIEVSRGADALISLSSLTFPHDITRLLLLEQIYRACTILKGEPYSH